MTLHILAFLVLIFFFVISRSSTALKWNT